ATFTLTPATLAISCPQDQTFCLTASGNYTIPELLVNSSCEQDAIITWEVTGATTANGTGTDASGNYDPGVSIITWTVETACTTLTCSITINIEDVEVILPTMDPLCINDDVVQLNPTPAGGTWVGNGVTQEGVFDPAAVGIGTHTITYTVTNSNGCRGEGTMEIVVNPLLTATI
ncbi:hypothetical protein, partial [Flavihumibacter sp. ZG627]|uniref:hypothetical protein n=1 Tax=Flavihumibacter sp. ZG627 TaxID=1463156 RepID=UPI00057C7965